MKYEKIEDKILDLLLELSTRIHELDPDVSGQDDLINELERMHDDLSSAVFRIERLEKLENKIKL